MSEWTQNLAITHADPHDRISQELLKALDWELLKRYPAQQIHGVDWNEVKDPRLRFLVAKLDDTPVGCGSIMPLTEDTAELKRMFVTPVARSKGIAKVLLAELEHRAKALGFSAVRLETGNRQPEAVNLYESRGYYSIPAFGEYVDDPASLCFEKRLDTNPKP